MSSSGNSGEHNVAGVPSSPDVPLRRHKRKRRTLSCIQCKKRKIKCDKSRPCANCVGRRETSLCVYEDGPTPPPHIAFPLEDLLTLRDRLDRLEHSASAPAYLRSPSSSSLRPPFPDTRSSMTQQPVEEHSHTKDVELAFSAVEVLAVSGGLADAQDAPACESNPQSNVQVVPSGSQQWPDVTAPMQTLTAMSTRWMRDMGEIVAAIPEGGILYSLLDFFFAELALSRHYIHESTFRQEIKQFEGLRLGGRHLTVDPAWLSILCSTLWVSAQSLLDEPSGSPHVRGLDRQTLLSITSRLFEALETALTCSNWLFRPQMRVLCALLIGMPLNWTGPYFSFFNGWQAAVTRCMWFDVAVGICKALHLHRLGSSAEPRSLPNDPMLPRHLPVYSREMAVRAFHVILFLDTFTTSGVPLGPMTLPYCFPQGSFDTAEPLNYDDDMLLERKPLARPLSEPTSIIWQIFKNRAAGLWRKIIDQLLHPEALAYEQTMALDRELRGEHEQLLSLRMYVDLSEQESIDFILTNSSFLQRLVRLHRPFYIRSFEDKRYEYSRMTALSAAKQMVLGHRKLMRVHGGKAAVRDALYLFVHHLSAIIVMFVQALYDPSSRGEMKEEIRISSEIFREAGAGGYQLSSAIGAKGYRAISAMLKALDEPSPDVPDVGRLFKEIEEKAKTPASAPTSAPATGTTTIMGVGTTFGALQPGTEALSEEWRSNIRYAADPTAAWPLPLAVGEEAIWGGDNSAWDFKQVLYCGAERH